jgi:hypothetical protein
MGSPSREAILSGVIVLTLTLTPAASRLGAAQWHSVAQPVAAGKPAGTFPTFGAFVLIVKPRPLSRLP